MHGITASARRRRLQIDVDGFLNRYYEMRTIGDGVAQGSGDAVLFDMEMLMYDERRDKPCQFSLREVGGTRRLGSCQTGPFEVAALLRELEHFVAPRPLTHRGMVSLMVALGGRLERILVDKLLPTERIYEAKLHIRQAGGVIVVDLRISDAVILAVICDAPIFVSNGVLVRLAEELP